LGCPRYPFRQPQWIIASLPQDGKRTWDNKRQEISTPVNRGHALMNKVASEKFVAVNTGTTMVRISLYIAGKPKPQYPPCYCCIHQVIDIFSVFCPSSFPPSPPPKKNPEVAYASMQPN